MKKGLIGCLVVVGGLLLLALIFGSGLMRAYNGLVTERESVDKSWAQVENVLQRRGDLIPNLVETVKGYAAHERGVFEEVTVARTRAQQAQSPAESAQAEGILGQALGRLFAVAEAYPDLKASENFRELQGQLEGTENQIAVARQTYNDSVLAYNNGVQTFPGAVLAGPFGFRTREFFQVEEQAEREAPHVDFTSAAATQASAAPGPEGPASTQEPRRESS